MGTSDLPKDPQNTLDPDSDRTLSIGGPGGAAADLPNEVMAPVGIDRMAGFREIGPYRLLQLLGEGGMGEVWLAEQKKPIHRTVALKLIKAGMDTKPLVARFGGRSRVHTCPRVRRVSASYPGGQLV